MSVQVIEEIEKDLTPEESAILDILRGRRMIQGEDAVNLQNFTLDSIDGLAPNLEQGKLGFVKAKPVGIVKAQHVSLAYHIKGTRPDMRTQRGEPAART